MTLLATRGVIGVQLAAEFGAALGLVALADRFGRGAQAVERPEEAAVRLVTPPYVARSPPPRLTEPVEAAVVADAKVRIRLDVVAAESSQLRPRVEETGPPRADIGDGVPPSVDLCQRGPEGFQRVIGLGIQNGLGRPGRREVNVGHREGSYGIDGRYLGGMPETEAHTAETHTPETATADDAAPTAKPKPPTRLVLVRHAVTAQTGPWLSGRMPGISLSEKGVGQADATAQRLAKLTVTAVYASPIERTTETAQQIAERHSLDVRALPGVIEADYGDWTGGKIADLAKTDEWKVVQVAPSPRPVPQR